MASPLLPPEAEAAVAEARPSGYLPVSAESEARGLRPPRLWRRTLLTIGVATVALVGVVAMSPMAHRIGLRTRTEAFLQADAAAATAAPPPAPGSDAWWGKAEWRARQYVKTMEPKDKFAMLHGQNGKWPYHRHGYAGYINTQRSLPGFKAAYKAGGKAMPLTLNDGPQGFNHYGFYPGTATQFPALLSVAASFSTRTSWRYANAVAEECVAKGANVLLGPDVEVIRVPVSGRSFETLSGEDPFLGSALVNPFVGAIQAKGIIVTVKHWIDNNQEIYRQTMNVEVGDRAQHEIYVPPFKAAIEAGAASVMCAYNKVYGVHACENSRLLQDLLRNELGFKGYIVSDWGATHDAERSAKAGLDVEMQGGPDDQYQKLASLVSSGAITQKMIDDKVVHVLSAMYAVGQFDGTFAVPQAYQGKNVWDLDKANDAVIGADVTSDAHRAIALETIIAGAVLIKNEEGTLPLVTAGKKIALVGKYCKETMDKSYGQGSVFSGGGSGYVETTPEKVITPFQGIKDHIKDATGEVTWGPDAASAVAAEVVVVCVAAHSEEGWDRQGEGGGLKVPEAAQLLTDLRALPGPKKTVVVLAIVPGAVTTEWIDNADAALVLFMPGEQVGVAAAQLLTGVASPGGRLPVTFPQFGEQRWTKGFQGHEQYPGVQPKPAYQKTWGPHLEAHFSEGVLVGYRWNDAQGVIPAFPFGFGLTYTDFQFQGFAASCTAGKATVSLKIVNIGKREGDAVPQLYVGFPSLSPALRTLRGFQKVHVAAGAEAAVTFTLGPADWSFFDEAAHAWVSAATKGETITVSVGRSSADLVWHHELSGC